MCDVEKKIKFLESQIEYYSSNWYPRDFNLIQGIVRRYETELKELKFNLN